MIGCAPTKTAAASLEEEPARSKEARPIEAGGGAARAVCCGPSEAAPAESVASAALRAGLRAWRLHPSQCGGRRAQAAAQCVAAMDTCGSVERSRPEGRARATKRRWHPRGTHWVEHGVRLVCMSCARGQLWRDEAACGRHQLVCRAGGAEQTLAAGDAADERTSQGGDRHPGPRFSASAHGRSERGHIILHIRTVASAILLGCGN